MAFSSTILMMSSSEPTVITNLSTRDVLHVILWVISLGSLYHTTYLLKFLYWAGIIAAEVIDLRPVKFRFGKLWRFGTSLNSKSTVANTNIIPYTGVVPEQTVYSKQSTVFSLGFLFFGVRVYCSFCLCSFGACVRRLAYELFFMSLSLSLLLSLS